MRTVNDNPTALFLFERGGARVRTYSAADPLLSPTASLEARFSFSGLLCVMSGGMIGWVFGA
jgi:hypothetical protein